MESTDYPSKSVVSERVGVNYSENLFCDLKEPTHIETKFHPHIKSSAIHGINTELK